MSEWIGKIRFVRNSMPRNLAVLELCTELERRVCEGEDSPEIRRLELEVQRLEGELAELKRPALTRAEIQRNYRERKKGATGAIQD